LANPDQQQAVGAGDFDECSAIGQHFMLHLATGGVVGALCQQAGISDEEANVYAEGLRRGGALVSAKVDDADAARVQAIMDRSSVRVADRLVAYRKSGWTKYDPAAKPFTRDEVIRERSLYR
jgi:hypothetical protein